MHFGGISRNIEDDIPSRTSLECSSRGSQGNASTLLGMDDHWLQLSSGHQALTIGDIMKSHFLNCWYSRKSTYWPVLLL